MCECIRVLIDRIGEECLIQSHNTHLSQLTGSSGKYSYHFEYQIPVPVNKSNVEHSSEF